MPAKRDTYAWIHETRTHPLLKKITTKVGINDIYSRFKHWINKKDFNKESQKWHISIVLDTSYAYVQNQDDAATS